jgi:hypothetical protein
MKTINAANPLVHPSQYEAPEILISQENPDGEIYAAVVYVRSIFNKRDPKNNVRFMFDTKRTRGLVHDIDAPRELYRISKRELHKIFGADTAEYLLA